MPNKTAPAGICGEDSEEHRATVGFTNGKYNFQQWLVQPKKKKIPTHSDLFVKAKGKCVDLVYVGANAKGTSEVINVGVKPAAAAGARLLQDTRLMECRIGHSDPKKCGVYVSSYPTPPAIPPIGLLMSEKPAFFPGSKTARPQQHPPLLSKKIKIKPLSMASEGKVRE